ncbi:hypothetical protein BCR33DRAFT_137895 [Rhizoclosmatium globosum]|uniref:Uncharacterized protein n=1 Tax=Rhizoclosmatium globosum TaxID=329046 RepID=A0A1Y2AKI7_9FUNG|nr:hypothetical protein BCR33DRAFT_137895 [Rhizoclosmatium globosum]|eukprot:ORY23073.1 hypothetical protein BCR33DRAFT_137895 [Rhizoclosmatium globosum]
MPSLVVCNLAVKHHSRHCREEPRFIVLSNQRQRNNPNTTAGHLSGPSFQQQENEEFTWTLNPPSAIHHWLFPVTQIQY